MEDNELRLKRSIEYIIEDSDEDKAERIMQLLDTVVFDIDEVIETCKDFVEVETDIYINADFVKERLGL